MLSWYHRFVHDRIILELKRVGAAPKLCEIVEEDKFTFVNYLNDAPGARLFPDDATGGFARTTGLASLKAACEWVEREAIVRSSERERFEHGSDGCAAYPTTLGRSVARLQARDRAFAEALERYVWARWWDDPQIAHAEDVVPIESHVLLGVLSRLVRIEKVIRVRPAHSRSADINLDLYFAHLTGAGVISGGAAGRGDVRDRALCELLRHGLAASRLGQEGRDPKSFYERRLAHFAQDRSLLDKRLLARGSARVELPPLAYDAEIEHELQDSVCVYQCLFEKQPYFIGGELERLCL